MPVSIIVAVADNGVIGNKDAALPWHLPADLAEFKRRTFGHSVIMGRKTYETIGRPLPGRQNIIITHNANYSADGCEIVTSLQNGLQLARTEEIFIIGGGEVYRQALPLASKLYLTQVHADVHGETTFSYAKNEWHEVSRIDQKADARNEFDYSFTVLDRIIPPN